MTDTQRRREIKPQERPRCVGTPKQPCGIIADPAIKGYDDQYRCYSCNDIHTELVFIESGDVAPGATQPRFKSVVPDRAREAAAKQLVANVESAMANRQPIALGGEHLDNPGAWRDANQAARMIVHERRMREAQEQAKAPATPPQKRPEPSALKAVLRKHGVKV